MWFIVPGTELVVQDRHISTEIVRYVSVHLLCYMLAEQGSLTTRCISYPSAAGRCACNLEMGHHACIVAGAHSQLVADH